MNALETRSLTKRYGRKTAVDTLDVTVPEGSICAFLGPNGAGKTTTIQLLMNLQPADAGEAFVLGVPATRLSPREWAQIGYVSENQKLPLWMTVQQLLDYCRPFYPTWDRELERTLLVQFDLPAERKLKHLSRGMLMKAALLSTLAYRPKLLVLDEPFSGLDPRARDDFVRGILEASGLGDWTVLVSSHDIEEVERLADNIALLENGRLRFSETTESLLGRFRRMEVTVSGPVSLGACPAGWLALEQKGGLVKFILANFDGEKTQKTCRDYFPEGAVVAHPMTLREIFVTLARETRTQPKGAAA